MAPDNMLATPASTPISPAGYGRSCTNCSRAKCKCMLRTDGASCERCHRLGKECVPMATSRRRIGKSAASSSSLRTAQLEEKLDDLVSILRASHQQNPGQPPPAGSHAAAVAAVADVYAQSGSLPSRLDSLAAAATGSTSSDRLGGCSTNESSRRPLLDPAVWPMGPEADMALEKFKTWVQQFPFVYIPPETTSETLRMWKPFLWMCIMNATSDSVPQQIAMQERVRREISQRIVFDQERNADIVLGLITNVSWATTHAGNGKKPFINLYLHLATSIAIDLGMTRPPLEEQYYATCFKAWGPRPPLKERTMEERRAILGLWFVSSCFESFVGKVETLNWSKHMEECLEVLDKTREQPSDSVLAALVKLQLIGIEAHRMMVRDVFEERASTPSAMFKKGWMLRLEAIRRETDPSVLSVHVIQGRMLVTELFIQVVGLFTTNTNENPNRIESMHACVRSIRSWYDLFFSLTAADFPGLPFSFFIEMSHTQMALYRITTCDDPTWDKTMIRNTADILTILDRTADKLLLMAQTFPFKSEEAEETMYVKGAKMMRNLRQQWEPTIMQHTGGLPTPNSQGMTGGPSSTMEPAPLDQDTGIMMDQTLDFTDTTWMADMFAPWDY